MAAEDERVLVTLQCLGGDCWVLGEEEGFEVNRQLTRVVMFQFFRLWVLVFQCLGFAFFRVRQHPKVST